MIHEGNAKAVEEIASFILDERAAKYVELVQIRITVNVRQV